MNKNEKGITPYQKRILFELSEGLTLREVAESLNASYSGTRYHYKNAALELGAKNITNTIATAIRKGIIT